MTLLGDFVKGFLIMTVIFWIFLMIEFILIGEIGFALLLIVGFIPPLCMIAYEHFRDRREKKTKP